MPVALALAAAAALAALAQPAAAALAALAQPAAVASAASTAPTGRTEGLSMRSRASIAKRGQP